MLDYKDEKLVKDISVGKRYYASVDTCMYEV